MPVCLLCLLPHDHVEAGAVLVTKDEASVVIVRLGVYVEGPFKVNSIKGRVPCRDQKKMREPTSPTRSCSVDSVHVLQTPWTYRLPGRDRCSWSAQSPCPAERGEGVKGHLRGWRKLKEAQSLRQHWGARSDLHAKISSPEGLFYLVMSSKHVLVRGENKAK